MNEPSTSEGWKEKWMEHLKMMRQLESSGAEFDVFCIAAEICQAKMVISAALESKQRSRQ